MVVVVFENLAQEFVLGVVDGFNDVFVVSGEIEEAATLSRRAKFGQDVLPCERHQIVGRVQPEKSTQMSKDPGRIILELEVILR